LLRATVLLGELPVNGEFKSTFLSLSDRNRSGIPFVEGKYNMSFCGVLA
jgi:hypothetical protein